MSRASASPTRYNEALGDVANVPQVVGRRDARPGRNTRSMHGRDRDAPRGAAEGRGIPTAIYYPKPLHRQTAYRRLPARPATACRCRSASPPKCISLPMHPYLTEADQDRIVAAVEGALAAQRRAAAE